MKIERHMERGGWVYDDPDEHIAANVWHLQFGFDLGGFDDWLESPGFEESERQDVLRWRARAFDAYRAGNQDAEEGWLLYLLTLQNFNLREAFLHPLALKGRRHGTVQAKRRKGKPARSDEYDPDRNARIQNRHARLVAAGRHDATQETANEFNLSKRQVSRIVR